MKSVDPRGLPIQRIRFNRDPHLDDEKPARAPQNSDPRRKCDCDRSSRLLWICRQKLPPIQSISQHPDIYLQTTSERGGSKRSSVSMPASDILMCPAPSPSLSTTMWGTFYPSPHDAAKNDSWIHHTNHNDLWTHDVLSPPHKHVVAHPPRHIPAFVASEETSILSTRRAGGSSSSTFDHVPLDVDKKMFRGNRQPRHPPANPKKIQHLQEEEARTQQAPPPRTITVVSPPPLSVTTTCHYEGRSDEDEERRMPPATLQVLETLWLDMEDGMDE